MKFLLIHIEFKNTKANFYIRDTPKRYCLDLKNIQKVSSNLQRSSYHRVVERCVRISCTLHLQRKIKQCQLDFESKNKQRQKHNLRTKHHAPHVSLYQDFDKTENQTSRERVNQNRDNMK